MATLLPAPQPHYPDILKRASLDAETRALAADLFRRYGGDSMLPIRDVKLRASDIGSCSAAIAAKQHGLATLEIDVSTQLMFDGGHLWGAWFGCLLKAASLTFWRETAHVELEADVVYDGIPGHVDALVTFFLSETHEPVEFKTSRTTGQLHPPDTKKNNKQYQVLQADHYAVACETQEPGSTPNFVVVTYGPLVGANKHGIPYEKMVQARYDTRDWKPILDEELARLRAAHAVSAEELAARMDELMDTGPQYGFCAGCKFAGCPRNVNPQRLVL